VNKREYEYPVRQTKEKISLKKNMTKVTVLSAGQPMQTSYSNEKGYFHSTFTYSESRVTSEVDATGMSRYLVEPEQHSLKFKIDLKVPRVG